MFYFLISACQTVSVVNGHQERKRAQEEEEERETKVLWNLGKQKQGCFCPLLWQDGQPDRNNAWPSSLCIQMCWQSSANRTPFPCSPPRDLHPYFPELWSLQFLSLILLRYRCLEDDMLDGWSCFSCFLKFIILFIFFRKCTVNSVCVKCSLLYLSKIFCFNPSKCLQMIKEYAKPDLRPLLP